MTLFEIRVEFATIEGCSMRGMLLGTIEAEGAFSAVEKWCGPRLEDDNIRLHDSGRDHYPTTYRRKRYWTYRGSKIYAEKSNLK